MSPCHSSNTPLKPRHQAPPWNTIVRERTPRPCNAALPVREAIAYVARIPTSPSLNEVYLTVLYSSAYLLRGEGVIEEATCFSTIPSETGPPSNGTEGTALRGERAVPPSSLGAGRDVKQGVVRLPPLCPVPGATPTKEQGILCRRGRQRIP